MINSYTEVLIVITAGPSMLTDWKGVAAATWQITPPGIDKHGLARIGSVGTEVSETAESNESEAALLALNAAMRHVEDEADVRVFTTQTWIPEGINGGAERWKNENWNGRSNKELWQEYLQICAEKSLRVQGEHVPGADTRFASTFRYLRKRARAARDKRSKELGTPNSGFDVVD
jgi:ribonuclease HI